MRFFYLGGAGLGSEAPIGSEGNLGWLLNVSSKGGRKTGPWERRKVNLFRGSKIRIFSLVKGGIGWTGGSFLSIEGVRERGKPFLPGGGSSRRLRKVVKRQVVTQMKEDLRSHRQKNRIKGGKRLFSRVWVKLRRSGHKIASFGGPFVEMESFHGGECIKKKHQRRYGSEENVQRTKARSYGGMEFQSMSLGNTKERGGWSLSPNVKWLER